MASVPLSLLIAMAFALETDLIPVSDLQKRVPMTTVVYESASLNPKFRTTDFLLTMTRDGANLARGRDKSGKLWQAILPPPIFYRIHRRRRNGARCLDTGSLL